MFRLFWAVLIATACLGASPVYQVTYDRGTAADDGTYVIGLTQLTLQGTGPAQTFQSMCFDFVGQIHTGQTYIGEAVKLTGYSSDPVQQTLYDMAGFAYFAMHDVPAITAAVGNGVTDWQVLQAIQYGVWDLMDPIEHDDGNIYHGYKYTTQVDAAVDWALANPAGLAQVDANLKLEFPHALDGLYVIQGVGRDANVQKFIIGVPEPGSIWLIGGGLLSLTALIRLRAKR
jgi:hypothetical protein